MNRYLSRCQPSSAAPPANRWRGIAISFGSVYCRAGAIVLLSLTVGAPLAAQSQNTSPSVPSPQSTVTDEARPTLKLGSQGAPVSNLQGVLKLLGFYTGTIDGLYQESTAEAVAAFQQAAGLQPDGIAGTETWNRLLPVAPAISQTTAGQTTAGQTGQPAPTLPATPSLVTPTPSPSPPGTASSFPAPTATPTPAISPTPTAVRPSPSPTAASTPAPSPSPGYIPATPSPAPLPTSPTPTASTSTATPILRLGMTGTDVRRLQERLRAIGLFTGAVDGIFGSETELAVQQAQRNYNLEPDGVVGPATWEALLQGS